MKSIYGLTNIRTYSIIFNTANYESERMNSINTFLKEHDGNIIDINFVPQALGQICAVITYKEEE